MKTRADMHRRAQKAEGRLLRVQWWLEAGIHHAWNEAKTTGIWPSRVPRFYLEEAMKELSRGSEEQNETKT